MKNVSEVYDHSSPYRRHNINITHLIKVADPDSLTLAPNIIAAAASFRT